MPTNRWQVGALYPPGGLNNVKWQQAAPGDLVYPQQQTGQNYLSIQPFNELSGIFSAGCGHFMNSPLLQQEYDYDTNSSCMLVTCALCGFCQYVIEPASDALNTVQYPWVTI